MKKGDVCEGIIERYDFPNKGSFQVDERKVTIKGALPGQKVKYMVTKKKSGMAEGKVLEVLERSPLEDVEPTCPYFGACGGCAYQTMSYDNQLKLKADMVNYLTACFWQRIPTRRITSGKESLVRRARLHTGTKWNSHLAMPTRMVH